MKWEENFSSLIRERDVLIEYEVSEKDGVSTTYVTFVKNGIEKKVPLKQYMKEEVDDSQHELIRTNVLNATRNFQHRVDAFIKEIVFGSNNPMKIRNISYKVEFQGRGAGHIHGVLWSDLSLFEKKDVQKEPEFEHLTNSFRKLRENEDLQTEESLELAMFVNKFVTCSLNPDKISKLVSNGLKLAELAEEVQKHKHT